MSNVNHHQSRVLRSALDNLVDEDNAVTADFIFGTARNLGFNTDRSYLFAELKQNIKALESAYKKLHLKLLLERYFYWMIILVLILYMLTQ